MYADKKEFAAFALIIFWVIQFFSVHSKFTISYLTL